MEHENTDDAPRRKLPELLNAYQLLLRELLDVEREILAVEAAAHAPPAAAPVAGAIRRREPRSTFIDETLALLREAKRPMTPAEIAAHFKEDIAMTGARIARVLTTQLVEKFGSNQYVYVGLKNLSVNG